MQAVVTNEIKSDSVGTSRIGGSRPGRESIFRDRELYHASSFVIISLRIQLSEL